MPTSSQLAFSERNPNDDHAHDHVDRDELAAIETTDELRFAPRCRDASLATARTVWAVRVGSGLFVRNAATRPAP